MIFENFTDVFVRNIDINIDDNVTEKSRQIWIISYINVFDHEDTSDVYSHTDPQT